MSSIASSSTLPTHSPAPSGFSVYDNAFYNILGSAPKLEVIAENSSFPFAHEASVYIPENEELFVSSNIFTDPATNESTIKISKVSVGANPVTSEVIDTNVTMANGATNYNGSVLWTAQGNFNETGGVVSMSTSAPYNTDLLVAGFYGRQFNSLNDIVVAKDGAFWFTDPIYGWRQGIRPKPQLRQQVYRYDPKTQGIRVVADGFGRPNGIAFSPDEKTAYITDTGETNGDGSEDALEPATM